MSVEFRNEKWKSQKNWFEKDRTHVDPHDSSHTCRFTCVTRYLFTSGVAMPNFSWQLDYIFLTSTWGLWSFRSHPLIWAWLCELNASHKADNSWITLRPPWTNCGWIMDLVEARKAQDYLDDSWGRSPLGRDQRPRLPRISSLVRSQRWLGWSRERGKQTCGINGASRWVENETVTWLQVVPLANVLLLSSRCSFDHDTRIERSFE